MTVIHILTDLKKRIVCYSRWINQKEWLSEHHHDIGSDVHLIIPYSYPSEHSNCTHLEHMGTKSVPIHSKECYGPFQDHTQQRLSSTVLNRRSGNASECNGAPQGNCSTTKQHLKLPDRTT